MNFFINFQMTDIHGTRFITMRDYCSIIIAVYKIYNKI
jgi:hypothetical protein